MQIGTEYVGGAFEIGGIKRRIMSVNTDGLEANQVHAGATRTHRRNLKNSIRAPRHRQRYSAEAARCDVKWGCQSHSGQPKQLR